MLGVEESAARPQDLPSRLQAGVAVSPDRGFPNMLLGRGLAWLAAEAPEVALRPSGCGRTDAGPALAAVLPPQHRTPRGPQRPRSGLT